MLSELNDPQLMKYLVASSESDYVKLAVQLGTSPKLRLALRQRLMTAVEKSQLFDDPRAIKQWTEVIRGAHHRAATATAN